VTTGLVVVVTGGLVVVGGTAVVGGDVTCEGLAAGGAVVVVVVGTTVVVVDDVALGAGGVIGGTGCGCFALAEEPGCSLATVTPMKTASMPATATDARVTRRIRTSARNLACGVQRTLALLTKAVVALGGPARAPSGRP
jgi:hypothetical protein